MALSELIRKHSVFLGIGHLLISFAFVFTTATTMLFVIGYINLSSLFGAFPSWLRTLSIIFDPLIVSMVFLLLGMGTFLPYAKHKSGDHETDLMNRVVCFITTLLLFGVVAIWWVRETPGAMQAVATVFAGSAALTAAYLAYRGAMAKVGHDREQFEIVIARKSIARSIQAAQVTDYIRRRIHSKLKEIQMQNNITRRDAHNKIVAAKVAPNKGLKSLIDSGEDVDPSLLLNAFALYEMIRGCEDAIADLGPEPDDVHSDSPVAHEGVWEEDKGYCKILKSMKRIMEKCSAINQAAYDHIEANKMYLPKDAVIPPDRFNADDLPEFRHYTDPS